MVIWNPFTPGYFDNPYPHLAECRQTNAVQKGIHREWILFKHKHVRQFLKSNLFHASDLSSYFKSKEPVIFGQNGCPFLAKGTRRWIMYLNDSEHTATSALADAALRTINITSLIEESIDVSLRQFEKVPSLNLADLASAIPFYFSKKMTGFDESVSFERLYEFSHQLAVSQDLFLTKDDYRKVNAEFEWAFAEFEKMLYLDNNNQKGTLVAVLPGLNDNSASPLSKEEMYSLMSILFMASFETTKDSLGIILYELIKNPLLLEYVLAADEKQIKVLTEELLRIASPLQYTVRVCREDIEFEENFFPAGTRIFLCLASANRDEEVFENPDEIIPDRQDNPHLSFGGGVHACLGARIAREEIRTWLKPLCRFLTNYKMAENEVPQWQRTIFMRGLKQYNIARK
jgi:cytochrome P450